jgi:hypothetical protein
MEELAGLYVHFRMRRMVILGSRLWIQDGSCQSASRGEGRIPNINSLSASNLGRTPDVHERHDRKVEQIESN